MQNSKINETEIRRIIKDELVKIFTADPETEAMKAVMKMLQENIPSIWINHVKQENAQVGDSVYEFADTQIMDHSKAIPGTIKRFPLRSGGFLDYLYGNADALDQRQHTQAQADQMLEDANAFLNKYFPWMKDFVIFQLHDGTVRIDAADRSYLGDD